MGGALAVIAGAAAFAVAVHLLMPAPPVSSVVVAGNAAPFLGMVTS